MGVAFLEAGGGDAHQAGPGPQLLDGGAAGEPHAGAQAAGELGEHLVEAPFVGDHALDPLRHQLGQAAAAGARAAVLEVAVGAAAGHGGERSHAAVGFEGAPLVEDGLAGALLGAGEERADHHRMGAGHQGLGHVAGELDAAVGNDGHVVSGRGARAVHDGGDLGDAGAGDDAGGADAPRPDAHLDGVGAALDESPRPLLGGHVAHHQLDLGEALAQHRRGVEHAAAVGMRGVEHQEIDLGLDQRRRALQVVAGGADRRAHAQPPELVLA